MRYVKLSDLVAIDEIRDLMEMDAKPRFNLCKGEEDAISRFWDAVFAKDEEINQEDFMGDEYSENARHR